jgi:hypothetical protein
MQVIHGVFICDVGRARGANIWPLRRYISSIFKETTENCTPTPAHLNDALKTWKLWVTNYIFVIS